MFLYVTLPATAAVAGPGRAWATVALTGGGSPEAAKGHLKPQSPWREPPSYPPMWPQPVLLSQYWSAYQNLMMSLSASVATMSWKGRALLAMTRGSWADCFVAWPISMLELSKIVMAIS